MKSRPLLSCLFFVSSVCLVSSLALADDPAVTHAKERVESGLVTPLAQHESSRFSRGRPAPRERRVRMTSAAESVDAKGRAFVGFAVDIRYGSGDWRESDIVGCAYTESGKIYVKRGEEYRPAEFLLGKDVGPVAGVCEAARPRS